MAPFPLARTMTHPYAEIYPETHGHFAPTQFRFESSQPTGVTISTGTIERFPLREPSGSLHSLIAIAVGLMIVVGRSLLDAFVLKHADARRWVEGWLAEAEAASWMTPKHVKERYASASFLGENAVIFNVKGNDYRMEVVIAYKTGVVTIRWIGTHAEYDSRNRAR